MPATPKFFVKSVSYALSAGVTTVTVVTDVACHLWLRWSDIIPQKHIVPVYRRGTFFRTDVRLCFVAFHENEQNEAGDVVTHTFSKPEWQICTTYYFYFHGQVAGTTSPSTSPIFNHHPVQPPFGPPETKSFYSDPGTGATTVDGNVFRVGSHLLWNDVRNGAGTHAQPTLTLGSTQIESTNHADRWASIARFIATFDTSTIPSGSLIDAALLQLNDINAWQELPEASSWAVVASSPASDNNLITADYQTLGEILLSEERTFPDGDRGRRQVWNFNPTGLDAINPGGITRLGVRDSTFDVPDIEPAWSSKNINRIRFASADNATPGDWPRLEVTFQPPL